MSWPIFIITPGDVLGFAALVVCLLFMAAVGVVRAVKRMLCRHDRVRETRACDAVCMDCGENLGFIGTYREKQRGKS